MANTDITPAMLMHNLVMMIEDNADEHLPLTDEDGNDTDVQWVDWRDLGSSGREAGFMVKLSNGQVYKVLLEEQG